MSPVSPIRLGEFLAAITKSSPPSGCPKIAVANSGGPDSTCLLFLFSKLITTESKQPLPSSVTSFHVNHNLQSASSAMATQAAANATLLRLDHRTLDIPWGEWPFPARPVPDTAVEKLAREARYHVIFNAMSDCGVSTVAFGHHADDQVETSLIRLSKGSTVLGAAGMRRRRRWGMGSGNSENALGWVGHRGMKRFIIRPLLDFSKDRILATCEAHGLNYVHDPSNFQPQLTLRNAVRCMLDAEESPSADKPNLQSLPRDISDSLEQIRKVSLLHSTLTDTGRLRERLRHATSLLAAKAEQIDAQVTKHLQECVLPSPPGTLLLSSPKLLEMHDPTVRSATVLRVLRYISFHPWGSIRADGDRRRAGIHRITTHLYTPHPEPALLRKFTAGGGVLWTPALYHPSGPLKTDARSLRQLGRAGVGDLAWLASRIPPFFKNPQEGAGSASRLTLDLTARFDPANAEPAQGIIEVLYDCRFLIRFDLVRMPNHVRAALADAHEPATIKTLSHTEFFWPKVVLQRDSRPDLVLAVLGDGGDADTLGSSPWILMEWMRPLDAT